MIGSLDSGDLASILGCAVLVKNLESLGCLPPPDAATLGLEELSVVDLNCCYNCASS